MADKKEEFNEWLFSKSGRQTSMISRDYGEKIIRYLREKREKGDSAEVKRKFDPQFRFHVNKKRFHILNVVGLGDILCLPVKDKTKASHAMLGQHRQVIFKEDMYDVIEAAHTQKGGEKHRGYKGTFKKINATYCNIPREVVHKYVELCNFCQKYHSCFVPNLSKRKSERKNPKGLFNPKRPRQDIPMDFLARCQVDIIDMTSQPDDQFLYIGHFMDHHTKFNVLFPLKSKESSYVARKLCRYVFAHFGLPRILYSCEGRDFVTQLIMCLFDFWSTDIQVINGNSKSNTYKKLYPVVEQRHKTVLTLIETIQAKNDHGRWSLWLPGVQYSLNTNVFEAESSPAFDTVLKRRPRLFTYTSSSAQVLKEEDVDFDDEQGVTFPSFDVSQISDFDHSDSLLPMELTTTLSGLISNDSLPHSACGTSLSASTDLDISSIKNSMPVIASTIYPFNTVRKVDSTKKMEEKSPSKSLIQKRSLEEDQDDDLMTPNSLIVKHSIDPDIPTEYIYTSVSGHSSQHLVTTSSAVALDNDSLGLIGIVTLNSPMTQINTPTPELARKNNGVMNIVALSSHESPVSGNVASVVDINSL